FAADPGTLATSVPEAGPIALLGHERNGTFFPGGGQLAAPAATAPVTATLAAGPVEPLLAEAIAHGQAAGTDSATRSSTDVRIADLPGLSLGRAGGHTVRLDSNAAGWDRFVDQTPWDDSEFATPGNQGERRRIDLLTVPEHELGHLLGREHEGAGVTVDT